jgi:hypothetical protein
MFGQEWYPCALIYIAHFRYFIAVAHPESYAQVTCSGLILNFGQSMMFTVSGRAFVRSLVVVGGCYYNIKVLDSNPAYYRLQQTNMIRVKE